MRTALTIAGSDSSGGAGIQADIKTMTANGVFALCAVTALTAQNTTGVTDIFDSTPHFLAEQLDAVFTDIFPDAVKIGMVSSAELIETIAAKLKEYGAKHIVVDPVMVATSGAKLLRDDAVTALCEKLLPLAEVLTPNIPEAEILSGMTMVFVPAVSTFYISQKMGSSSTVLIGDVIERQFKQGNNPNLGAALSIVLMLLVFVCTGIMNRFGGDEEGSVVV